MKLFFAFVLIGCLTTGVSAQDKKVAERNVPSSALNYLRQNYPTAHRIEYYQKKAHDTLSYEVEFVLNNEEFNLKFSSVGQLLETEREIEIEYLPAILQQRIYSALNENFSGAKIKKIQEVDPQGKKQYEVKIKNKKSKKYKPGYYAVMFDINGQMLSIEEEKLESLESVF